MNSLELLFTFLFVIIIIFVTSKNLPSELVVGACALWFTILWIGFDNMGKWENSPINQALVNCNLITSKETLEKRKGIKEALENNSNDKPTVRFSEALQNDEISKQTILTNNINDMTKTIEDNLIQKKLDNSLKMAQGKNTDTDSSNKAVLGAVNPHIDDTVQRENPMPLTYSEENYKYNLFDGLGSRGDNLYAHKMKQTSNKNREAMDNFSRTYSKYSNINYLEQELNDASASYGWWDDDAHLSTKF